VAVKIKHYDPIPNIEWWDTELLPAEQGNYIPLEAIE
jgi:U4/U6 small nuclear ribonucleoprotein PRP3